MARGAVAVVVGAVVAVVGVGVLKAGVAGRPVPRALVGDRLRHPGSAQPLRAGAAPVARPLVAARAVAAATAHLRASAESH